MKSWNISVIFFVITSYSIHYTKLYEGRGDEALVAVKPVLGEERAYERQKGRVVHGPRNDVLVGEALGQLLVVADVLGQKGEAPGVYAEVAVYEPGPDLQCETGEAFI